MRKHRDETTRHPLRDTEQPIQARKQPGERETTLTRLRRVIG